MSEQDNNGKKEVAVIRLITSDKLYKGYMLAWYLISPIALLLAIWLGSIESIIGTAVIVIFTYAGFAFWYSRFHDEGVQNQKKKNPYRWVFFGSVNIVSIILLAVGIFAAFMVYSDPDGNIFEALGLLVMVVWAVIFLRYFVWAIYFYNINYGWTDKDWEYVMKAREARKPNDPLSEIELKAPEKNPFAEETFGLPTGTVRGMIAFTLLFGAISMLIASFGKSGDVNTNSFYWDHFEFYKNAFLMMIAFYFGDKSLKTLQKNSNKDRLAEYQNKNGNGNGNDDESGEETEINSSNDNSSQNETSQVANTTSGSDDRGSVMANLTDLRKSISSLGAGDTGLIPIIDAGHGGLDDSEKYTTGNAKLYKFDDLKDSTGTVIDEGFVIYEGVVNRQIGNRLAQLLDQADIPYKELTLSTSDDVSLEARVKHANDLFKLDKSYYLLSIHSNASAKTASGKGTNATGFEVFTSVGQTKSDTLASIAAKNYMTDFPSITFRKGSGDNGPDKDKNFYVLKHTACPAFLVENLFFDNRQEARFLMSEEGQQRIALCLFKTVKEIYETQSEG